MKTVDAYWEKRNLGVDTTEFTIENGDKLKDVLETLNKCSSQYQVLRLPSHMTEFIFEVQKVGFVYVEDMVTMKSELRDIKLDSISQRLYKFVSFETMSEKDIIQLKDEVRNGLFYTDRIYIDPAFSTSLAHKRYVNWIEDELSRNALFYKFIYKNQIIGFSILKEISPHCFDGFLGGLYKNYQKSGFGNVLNVADIVKSLGGKSLVSNVSSNNFSQIKNLVNKGYYPWCSYHIFVKHNNTDLEEENDKR